MASAEERRSWPPSGPDEDGRGERMPVCAADREPHVEARRLARNQVDAVVRRRAIAIAEGAETALGHPAVGKRRAQGLLPGIASGLRADHDFVAFAAVIRFE